MADVASPDCGLKSANSTRVRAEDESQKKILENWVNKNLTSRHIEITDLFDDLKDGVVLYNLCEVLSGEDLKKYGKMSKGKMRIQLVANQNVIFKYLRSNPGIRLLFVGPPDVVDGTPTLVLGLMWSIMEFFALHALQADGVDVNTAKKRLLHWLMTHTVPSGASETPFDITHLAKSLQDGAVLLAVLHHFDPDTSAAHTTRLTGVAGSDLNTALNDFESMYGVDKLLDPYGKLDEKFTVPYLLDLVKKMNEKFPDKCKPITDAFLDSPPASGAAAAAATALAAEKLERELKEAQDAAMNDVASLNMKIKQLEMENEKLQACVNSMEEKEMEHKVRSPRVSARPSANAAPPLPTMSAPPPPSGAAPPPPSASPPPPPTSPAPAPPSANLDSMDDAALKSKIQELEASHALEIEEAVANCTADLQDHFAEVESRHVARADDLEARILDLEKDKTNDVLRHAKAMSEMKEAAASALAEVESRLKEAEEVAAAAKVEKDLMVQKVRDQDTERRKLHNLIQELRGNVRVFARVRPFLKQDGEFPPDYEPWLRGDADGSSIHALARVDEEDTVRDISHTFQYDRVFDQKDGQDVVFLEVSEFVQSALDGYNVCLFSYGQTGSGKTHTMTGAPHGEQRGIIPRAIEQVASRKVALEAAGWSFDMEISFLEIYCEQIRDLLGNPEDSADGQTNSKKYKIIANEFGQNIVTNVEMVPVDPADTGSIDELMQHAASLRSTSATKMNAESSRSHSIFTLHLTAYHEKQGVTLHGQLNLVDLAGSERIEKSGVSGQALTEAKHINTSLSALSGVFLALGKKNSHVPFRDSKLTELLHPALSANGKTLMMLNLSPIENSLSESISSLRFGTSVNSCELGKAKRVIKRKDQGAVAASKVSSNNSGKERRASSPVRTRSPGRLQRIPSGEMDKESSTKKTPVKSTRPVSMGRAGRGPVTPPATGRARGSSVIKD